MLHKLLSTIVTNRDLKLGPEAAKTRNVGQPGEDKETGERFNMMDPIKMIMVCSFMTLFHKGRSNRLSVNIPTHPGQEANPAARTQASLFSLSKSKLSQFKILISLFL